MTIPTEDTADMTAMCWRDDTWLYYHGSITPATALSYFARSPFANTTGAHEVIQQRDLQQSLPSTTPGVEYTLLDAQPPHLFVIRKAVRSDVAMPKDLAYYYILDGTIYQAPAAYKALNTRLRRFSHHMREVFGDLQADLDSGVSNSRRETEREAALEQEIHNATRRGEGYPRYSSHKEECDRQARNLTGLLTLYPLAFPAASAELKM